MTIVMKETKDIKKVVISTSTEETQIVAEKLSKSVDYVIQLIFRERSMTLEEKIESIFKLFN